MSTVPAPTQTLKVKDQYADPLYATGYQDGSLQVNNLEMKELLIQILTELKYIRLHMQVLTDENISEENLSALGIGETP